MELSNQLICQCNNKVYKTAATLKAHLNTQAHQYWELQRTARDLEIRATRLDNENLNLRRLNYLLIERVNSLENGSFHRV